MPVIFVRNFHDKAVKSAFDIHGYLGCTGVATRACKKLKPQLPTAIAARNARNAMFTKLRVSPWNKTMTAFHTNHSSSDKRSRIKDATTVRNAHSSKPIIIANDSFGEQS
jgi:hypothetical protein